MKLLVAFLVLPLTCFASGHDDCILDASRRPTDSGVKLARQACDAKFATEIEARRAAADETAAVDASAKAAMWRLVGTKYKFVHQVVAFMGPPLLVSGPGTCIGKYGRTPPASKCMTYLWVDTRAGRSRLHFMAQVENVEEEPIWQWSRDSFELE